MLNPPKGIYISSLILLEIPLKESARTIATFCTTIEIKLLSEDNALMIEERVKTIEEIASLGHSIIVTAEPLMLFDHEEKLL